MTSYLNTCTAPKCENFLLFSMRIPGIQNIQSKSFTDSNSLLQPETVIKKRKTYFASNHHIGLSKIYQTNSVELLLIQTVDGGTLWTNMSLFQFGYTVYQSKSNLSPDRSSQALTLTMDSLLHPSIHSTAHCLKKAGLLSQLMEKLVLLQSITSTTCRFT